MTRTIYRERLHQTSPRYGRHVWHDSESRRYPFNTAGLRIRSVRHQRHVPVYDQGQIGACTGNAAVGCLGTGLFFGTLRTDRTQYKHLDEGDAVTCYSAATRIDETPGEYPPTDTGSSGLAVAKVLTDAGLIGGYRHTFTLDDALKALTVTPLICGTVWTEQMDHPGPQGLVATGGRELGGHEYIVDEYNEHRGWVGLQNSWGTSYGVAGRFYMQAEDFGALLDRQGDVTVFTPATKPAPVPDPEPINPDAILAATLHQWLTNPSRHYALVREAAARWLDAKHL